MKEQQLGTSQKRILIIDDDQDIRESLEDILEMEGYHVLSARDGAEALRVLEEGRPPSIILLDLMMPTMSGWQFAPALQQDPALRDIPVVVITANDKGRQLAPDNIVGLFSKPLDLEQLLRCIEDHATEISH